MNKKESKEFKKRLIDIREKISEGIRHLGGNGLNKSQRDASGDLSAYTFHMADVATDNYDREFSLELASNERNILYEIDRALEKISEGEFGVCETCKKSIPKARLKAVPYARLCIGCQEAQDR